MLLKTQGQISKKNAYFETCKAYHASVIRKAYNWPQVYIQTSSKFYSSNDVCSKITCQKEKNIGKETSLEINWSLHLNVYINTI